MQPRYLCGKEDKKIKDHLSPHSMNCRISTHSTEKTTAQKSRPPIWINFFHSFKTISKIISSTMIKASQSWSTLSPNSKRRRWWSALNISRGDKTSLFPYPLTPPRLPAPQLVPTPHIYSLYSILSESGHGQQWGNSTDSQTGMNILRGSPQNGLCSIPLI